MNLIGAINNMLRMLLFSLWTLLNQAGIQDDYREGCTLLFKDVD